MERMNGALHKGGPLKIALLGNHTPRLCGIATFTADFARAIRTRFEDVSVDIYAMNDPGSAHAYPPEVVGTIDQDDPLGYSEAAHAIGASKADLLWVQHEYGIFGGPAGDQLLRLLDRVSMPVVVTLHTVLTHPNDDQRRVLEAIARRADRLVVMAEKGREILRDVHGIAPERVMVLPHGIPDRPFLETEAFKARHGFEGRRTILTFGLLSPNKGIEAMIEAMPRIVETHPDALYIVLGTTHPHLVAREGERYRESLVDLAARRGVSAHVRFIDAYLDLDPLLDYLAAADVYVTPYLNEAQITSGTLSYAVGLGKPVVSTPYWHAQELLADGIGRLVGFSDSVALADAVSTILSDDALRKEMRTRAYARGRTMLWSALAGHAVGLARLLCAERPVRLPARSHPAPRPSLKAMARMSDSCGIYQHSIFSIPDRRHGYCLDDNARALILAHRVPDAGEQADALIPSYCAFIQHAWNDERGRFRNFMSFDRQWLEEVGSNDSFGRGVWALGITVAEAARPDVRRWARHLFDKVLPHAFDMGSMRAWAFTILGADAVLSVDPAHALALRAVERLSRQLLKELRANRREGWTWFEHVLAYDNARLPEALLRAGHRLGDSAMVAEGLRALEWLDAMQTAEAGHFRAVGTESFGRPYAPPLPFDQQPLEAWAAMEAAEIALELTGDGRWLTAARHAHGWYLGHNDLGVRMGEQDDGGCFDGLMPQGANLNQGAESILAFQLAECAMLRILSRQANRQQTEAVAAAE